MNRPRREPTPTRDVSGTYELGWLTLLIIPLPAVVVSAATLTYLVQTLTGKSG